MGGPAMPYSGGGYIPGGARAMSPTPTFHVPAIPSYYGGASHSGASDGRRFGMRGSEVSRGLDMPGVGRNGMVHLSVNVQHR